MKKNGKYLDDQFTIEISKIKIPKSVGTANEMETPKWPHFKLLYDRVKPCLSSGNPTISNDEWLHPVSQHTSVPEELREDLDDLHYDEAVEDERDT